MAASRIRTTASIALRHPCSRKPTSSSSFSTSSRCYAAPSPDKHYYVTTPIFYVNAAPHIGHLHSTLLADVYTRYHALRSPQLPSPILCTGTDEHGLKIQRVAEGKGITPGALCDDVSERFRALAKAAGIEYTVFMRTTEERHKVAVQHVWNELNAKGFIYKSSYAGWYAVSDEAYYSEAQVTTTIDPLSGGKIVTSTETGTKVEWMEEETYKFRLSAFREPLIAWLSAEPSVLQPPSRSEALLASLASPTCPDFNDLSISRPSARLSWGIRVPNDEEQTIYVWIDALVNYLTASGYPWKVAAEETNEKQVWPPELMVIGKDIIRFHAIYLPAILLALDLPMPRTIMAHGHWTMNKMKMSKSTGNVVDPFELMKTWGRDAVRCWLIRVGGNPGSDSDYSTTSISAFYRKDLMGQLGNLTSRISAPKLLSKLSYPEQISVEPITTEAEDVELIASLNALPGQVDAHLAAHAPHKALSSIFAHLALTNAHLSLLAPWSASLPLPLPSTLPTPSPNSVSSSTPPSPIAVMESAEYGEARVHRALFHAREALRICAPLLSATMPERMSLLLDRLNVPVSERGVAGAWMCVGKGERTALPEAKGAVLFEPVDEGVKQDGQILQKKRKPTQRNA